MARIDWVEERLQNWARWWMSSGGGGAMGYAAVNMGDVDGGRSGYVTATIPILEVEASDTDAAVQSLRPGGLRLTVWDVYCGQGGIADKAARLCCSVATVHSRIGQAHQQIAASILERQARRRDERARVEDQQRTARQRGFSALD